MQPIEHLRAYLSSHKQIPFAVFMQQALYAPHWGYYNRGTTPFGAAGDFITAPELTPLFGYTLANQCAAVFKHLKSPVLFEFGAGSGRLCIDVLTHLEKQDALPKTYHILEISGALKALQQQQIEKAIPHLAHCVTWHTTLPKAPFEGIIIANEVLDAMPVHRFLKTNEGIFESMIGLNSENQLTEYFNPSDNAGLIDHVNQVIIHDVTPYLSEANLYIQAWLNSCFEILTKGAAFLIDYGFPRHEYYHPDRNQGTLMCHYQHTAHTNPLMHPGEEDITAHVDFTHVADSALLSGFQVSGYTNQASFLLANGLLSLLSEANTSDIKNQISTQLAVKKLLQPNEMGELFKVIGLTKALDIPLTGFELHDKRASLGQ